MHRNVIYGTAGFVTGAFGLACAVRGGPHPARTQREHRVTKQDRRHAAPVLFDMSSNPAQCNLNSRTLAL
jgi:hypothetical protein